jgi:trans-aconitate methyltransferase
MSDPILDSWHTNAQQWIATIEGEELESRRLVTNQAIIDIILKYQPKTLLDVGCGEGWLSRALSQRSIQTLGVDGVPTLIESARQKGSSKFEVATYQDLIKRKPLPLAPLESAAINFALLDQQKTEALLPALKYYLKKLGWLFIQTLHPHTQAGDQPYQSGWRSGSWDGLKQDFTQPYEWYFRTLQDWVQLFSQSGYQLKELWEPLHPKTGKPASIIFVLQA